MAKAKPDQASVGQPKGYAERLQFNQLVAKNPNYFGNYPVIKLQPVFPLSNDTTFEELTCVGYNADLAVLEAIVQIKQSSGYLGDDCSSGSYEYIRFYVNTGSGFQDVGLVAINVHDLPNGSDCAKHANKPLSYAASVPYSPPNTEDCDDLVLPLVRAILSWQSIPTSPTFPVIWGNALDRHVQLKPGPTKIQDIIEDLFEDGILSVPSDPAPLPLAQLTELYTGKESPTRRLSFVEAYCAFADPVFSGERMADEMAQLATLKIDRANIVGALTEDEADVSFEQLGCVGLEGVPGFERLVATIRVKQTDGYSGDSFSTGSFEYVAFWADWDNKSGFTYLGTAPVRVHDINRTDGEDLCYAAVLPVDLSYHRAGCEVSKIVRIRAVLSWNVPPSTTDPNALNFWGNVIDSHVQIRPAEISNPLNLTISIIGGIPAPD